MKKQSLHIDINKENENEIKMLNEIKDLLKELKVKSGRKHIYNLYDLIFKK